MFFKSASFIRIICSSDGQSIFDILNVVFCIIYYCRLGRPAITANVWQLGEVAEIEAQMFSFAQKFNRRTALQFSTKPAILPNCCYVQPIFRSSVTARFVLLNWWTFHCSVTAINTTVALQWFQSCLATFTFVEVLTSICRHFFFFLVSTVGTSYR